MARVACLDPWNQIHPWKWYLDTFCRNPATFLRRFWSRYHPCGIRDRSRNVSAKRRIARFRREFVEHCIFPEWLDFGEDMYLNLKWRGERRCLKHAAGADVGFRPRRNLQGYFRQYFNYARGDGQGGMLWSRHLIRYSSYAAGVWLLGILAPNHSLALLVLTVAGSVYLRRHIAGSLD